MLKKPSFAGVRNLFSAKLFKAKNEKLLFHSGSRPLLAPQDSADIAAKFQALQRSMFAAVFKA
jgi:hypothetical protein